MMQHSYRLLRNGVATFCLVATALLMSLGAYAQDRQVSGKVTDATDGTPIPGVNVSVKGTNTGANTGADGTYRLSAGNNATLVFSFVGYTSQEIPVGGQTTLDVKLGSDVKALEEVVVTGYGTSRKKDLTGSIAQVSAKDFNPGVNANALGAIQGRVAGLVITQTSGDPNGLPQVRLRGITSLTGNTDPLTVVDGVIGVPLNSVSPTDIETIDVLKDASAAAIYGSRAANGVIVITTKRGKEGRTSVSYSGYGAIGTTARKLPFLTGDQYREQVRRIKGDADLKGIDAGGNTDWIKEISQTAYIQSHDLSIMGGGAGFSYRGSLNYLGQPGLLKNTGFDRVTGRINIDQKAFNNRLNVQYNLAITNDIKKLSDGDITYRASLFLPVFPVRNADGSYFERPGSFDLNNPVAMFENQTWNRSERTVIGGMNIRYEILDGLTIGTNAAYRLNNSIEGRKFNTGIKAYLARQGEAQRRTDETNNSLIEFTANYVKPLNDNINMNLLAGYSFQQNTDEGFGASNQGFVTDNLSYNNLGQGTQILQNPSTNYVSSYKNETRLISFFGRATFNLFDKYNVTATVRRDGSSKFGANNKWGVFPSVAAAWNLSEEAFLKDNATINFLKLRVGWGQTGNSEGLAPYGSIERYGPARSYYDGASGQWQPGYGLNQNENPNLRWEVVETANIALDFALLSNRLTGNLDFYDKATKNMLYNYTVPVPPYKVNQLQANVGQMSNKGVELTLNYAAIQRNDFTWNVSLIASKFNTKVKSLSNDEFKTGAIRFSPFGGRGLSDVFASQLIEGRPLGEFLIPEFAGFSADGKMLLVATGGGTTSDYEKAELKQFGNPQPTFTTSLTNSFTYKNFDLSFLLRGVFGNKILNNTRSNFSIPGSILESNAFTTVADQPINYSVNQLSSYWLESGSFVRLDNLQLGYTVPTNSKILSRARVYLAGQNLFLITKYTGTDPELDTRGVLENDGRSQRPGSIGVDNRGIYPKQRTVQLGVNLTF